MDNELGSPGHARRPCIAIAAKSSRLVMDSEASAGFLVAKKSQGFGRALGGVGDTGLTPGCWQSGG